MQGLRRPNVIAVEGYVLPAERGDVGEQIVADGLAPGAQFGCGAAEIDGVPQDHGGDGEIEAGRPVFLIFEGPVADFAEAMKEHRPGERVARLALVEAGVGPPPQRRVADPVEGEERALQAPDLPQRLRPPNVTSGNCTPPA